MTWDKQSIQNLLKQSNRAVEKAVVAIYRLQTDSERAMGETCHHNNVGFSSYDAPYLSQMAERVLRGWSLTPGQLAATRNKMLRYHRQLAEIANSKPLAPRIVKAEPADPEAEEEAALTREIQRREREEEHRRIKRKFQREERVSHA